MKIAVLNYSGNVGKTTIARDLLKSNLPDYEIVTIDTVNTDGKETMTLKGKDGKEIYFELLVRDNLILDIGSSNLEEYLKNTERHRALLEYIDKFIIPITPYVKQNKDSLKTVNDLIKFGVKPKKIYIIANIVDRDEENILNSEEFKILKEMKVNVCGRFIPKHEIYRVVGSVSAGATDNTDYITLLKEAKSKNDEKEIVRLANLHILQDIAIGINNIYLEIFDEIFKE